MVKIPNIVSHFLEKQGYVVISTIDKKTGHIHCAAKGIVGLDKKGMVFIIDLYKNRTYRNLKKNPAVSITAIDETTFTGYTLQGKGKIVPHKEIEDHVIAAWENKIIQRISARVKQSVQSGKKSHEHHEIKLPKIPSHLIEVDVDKIIDLSPPSRIPKDKKEQ